MQVIKIKLSLWAFGEIRNLVEIPCHGLCFFCWVPSWGAEWISIVQLKQSWQGRGQGCSVLGLLYQVGASTWEGGCWGRGKTGLG